MQNKQPLILDAEHHAALFGCLARCTPVTYPHLSPILDRHGLSMDLMADLSKITIRGPGM